MKNIEDLLLCEDTYVLEDEIKTRQELHTNMVGWLYKGVIVNEIIKIMERIKEINNGDNIKTTSN